MKSHTKLPGNENKLGCYSPITPQPPLLSATKLPHPNSAPSYSAAGAASCKAYHLQALLPHQSVYIHFFVVVCFPNFHACKHAVSISLSGYQSLSLRLSISLSGYHASMDVYVELQKVANNPRVHSLPLDKNVNICVGKEWYRFPSHFFLPSDR